MVKETMNSLNPTLHTVQTYWSGRAQNFGQTTMDTLRQPVATRWLVLLEQALPIGGPLKILDIGTGAGFFAVLLAKQGHSVVGIDLTADLLKQAQTAAQENGVTDQTEFLQMDAQSLSFEDATFDAVVSRNLTWTLPSAEAAYGEWHRVLKPGGTLINFDSDYADVSFAQQRSIHPSKQGIPLEELAGYDELKRHFDLSAHSRPTWDVQVLQGLGLQVQVDADVLGALGAPGEDCIWDGSELFRIVAKKPL